MSSQIRKIIIQGLCAGQLKDWFYTNFLHWNCSPKFGGLGREDILQVPPIHSFCKECSNSLHVHRPRAIVNETQLGCVYIWSRSKFIWEKNDLVNRSYLYQVIYAYLLLWYQAKLKKGDDNGHGNKSYNSWLAWWRSTITTDDFLKFLSTQVTTSSQTTPK